jgi:hypothetical protein
MDSLPHFDDIPLLGRNANLETTITVGQSYHAASCSIVETRHESIRFHGLGFANHPGFSAGQVQLRDDRAFGRRRQRKGWCVTACDHSRAEGCENREWEELRHIHPILFIERMTFDGKGQSALESRAVRSMNSSGSSKDDGRLEQRQGLHIIRAWLLPSEGVWMVGT